MRCHISLTGLPILLETIAASNAASQNRWRPNEPPPSVTCTTAGRPSAFSISPFAQPGDLRLDQISALSLRTSATAQFVSSGSPGRKWNVNSCSIVSPAGSAGDERHLGLLQLGQHVGVGLALDASGPPLHLQPAHRVDALAERLRAHGDAALDEVGVRDDGDVGDAGHLLDRREILDLDRMPVDRRRAAEHRRQRAGDVEVHRELLLPGDDGVRVDAALLGADQLQSRLRAQSRRSRPSSCSPRPSRRGRRRSACGRRRS